MKAASIAFSFFFFIASVGCSGSDDGNGNEQLLSDLSDSEVQNFCNENLSDLVDITLADLDGYCGLVSVVAEGEDEGSCAIFDSFCRAFQPEQEECDEETLSVMLEDTQSCDMPLETFNTCFNDFTDAVTDYLAEFRAGCNQYDTLVERSEEGISLPPSCEPLVEACPQWEERFTNPF